MKDLKKMIFSQDLFITSLARTSRNLSHAAAFAVGVQHKETA